MSDYPHEYERALRYSSESNVTEKDFHRAIDNELKEKLNHGAYADWLDEQDKPAHAELVRRSSESKSEFKGNGATRLGGVWRNYGMWDSDHKSRVWYYPNSSQIVLHTRSEHDPNLTLEFHSHGYPPRGRPEADPGCSC